MNAGQRTERFVFPHFDRFKQFFQALLEGLNNRQRRQSPYFCTVEHTEKMDKSERQKNARALISDYVHFLTNQERMIQHTVDRKCSEMEKRIEQMIDRKIEERLRS